MQKRFNGGLFCAIFRAAWQGLVYRLRYAHCGGSSRSTQNPALALINRLLGAASLALCFALTPAVLQAADVQHVYDRAGRLVQTTAPNGMSVVYIYDAVGNLIANQQKAANELTLVEFTPYHGAPGTAVTLYGSGFDPVAANNAVTFNGVAATVTQASAYSLVVTVPASATTGPITVTNSHGTVSSATPFTVGNPLVADGPPVAVYLGPSSNIKFAFSGNAGEGYTLGLTGIATNANISVTVTQPTGTMLVTCLLASDGSCVVPYLPLSGSYTVTLATGASAATLSLCQGDPNFPHLWELKIPHLVHIPACSLRNRPALSFSFNRYELPRILRVTA